MSQGNSQYPISRLISACLNASGLRPSEFVARIGYRNATKGLRRLNEWLQDGSGEAIFLDRLVDTFRPDPDELAAALTVTEAIHERERREAVREVEIRERRRFRPFVWVVTEDSAHSFLTAIGERQVKTLWFPDDFEGMSAPERLATAQRRVREHFTRTTGKYVGFGKILRYQYTDTFDTSVILDTDGNVVEQNGGQFLLPEVWMELHP